VADISRVRKLLGYRRKYSLEKGLEAMVKHFRNTASPGMPARAQKACCLT